MTENSQGNLGGLIDPGSDLDRTALIDLANTPPGGTGRHYSRSDLDALASGVARGLVARGMTRGQAVAILAENSANYLACYMGTLRAGLVAVPINYRQPAQTIAHIVADSETRLIFADKGLRHLCPHSVPVITLDDDTGDFRQFLDPGPFTVVIPEPGETAMILYTSGSTGMPKGVMLSHAGQLYALSRWEIDRSELSSHRLLVAAPQYHMNALFVSKLALYYGASIALLPRFDVVAYLRAIPRHQVTWLTSVPTMLALVIRERELLDAMDYSSVQRISMGSAPLTESLFDAVQSCFPSALIANLYGTTEHGPSAFGAHPGGFARPKLSIGYPAPGMELRLVDGADTDTGILEVRSPTNMTGYKNLPEKTRAVLRDGWYRTSDVMTRDANGFYFILGRDDDMFVCNGENIFPGEVEHLLETHPGIAQASVVPVEDPIRGHAPVAFVVKARNVVADEAEIQAFARKNGPAYQYPRRVMFVESLPLAGTGKIDRNALIRRAKQLE